MPRENHVSSLSQIAVTPQRSTRAEIYEPGKRVEVCEQMDHGMSL